MEDNEDVLLYLSKLFESVMEVQVARNGLDGWEQALDSIPDLVISDIMVPQSNGLELCKK